MPGVPSGRACDACRIQRKKCDQKTPVCTRCERMELECVGSGKQRFKFVNSTVPQSQQLQPQHQRRRHQHQDQQQNHEELAVTSVPLRRGLTSQTSRVAGHYVSRLSVTDARYDVICYGVFLAYIPERIGTCKVLDLAVDTFSEACTVLHSQEMPVPALVKHGQTLTALREFLQEPPRHQHAELLCAVYITMLNETLMGVKFLRSDACHAEGVAYLLQLSLNLNWKSNFEMTMLMTMCFTVLFESIGNPRLKLEPWFSTIISKLDGGPEPQPAPHEFERPRNARYSMYPSLSLRVVNQLAALIREPATLDRSKLQAGYELLSTDKNNLRQDPEVQVVFTTEPEERIMPSRPQRAFQGRYVIALTMSLIFNRHLQPHDPLNQTLKEEMNTMIQDFIEITEASIRYLPLGAWFALSGLSVCTAATTVPTQQIHISHLFNRLLGVYERWYGTRDVKFWEEKFAHYDARVERARRTKARNGSSDVDEEIEAELVAPTTECHIQ